MKLTFRWPNDSSTQDSEFILDDYSYTQCYYNELLPADNYASVSIPWDTDIANKLRLLKDDNIGAVIYDDDDNPIFTGYIDNGIDFTKSQRLKPISLKLINSSFLLRQAIGETFAIKNSTVKSIVIQLLARLGGILSNTFDIPAVVPVMIIHEDEEYYEIIETLLFEYGYVFDFDNNGKFTVLPIFNQPSTVANIFNGSNIRRQVQEIFNKREFDYIRTKFNSVSINPNDLVYDDTAEKEVPPGLYFGHESETGTAQLVDNGAVYCEYQSSKGDVLWADISPNDFTILTNFSSAFIIEKDGTIGGDIPTYLGNKGTSYAFRAKNNSTYTAKIREIKAIGTSYTGITCYEVSKNGSLLKEYDSKYLQDRSNAASFTRNLSNYYRYSSIKLKLESYDDFPYGSFVTVSEAGIGEITARIVRKTYKLNTPIAYELESVTDFIPASITGEETHGTSSANTSGRGLDINPPSPPTGLTLMLRDDGKVNGTFTFSSDDDIHFYTVYRKTPEMPYKTVLMLDADVNSFVDESAINGMAYTYKIIATDNSGNVSNPSNEASIGTVTADRPTAPISASANAYEDYITVSITPPTLTSSNRDIYAPAEYKIQISRNGGSTYSDVVITANTGYDYYFNRTVDGYPEIGTLSSYRFRIYSVNIYGNLSASAVVCSVSTGNYATWTPTKPVITGSGTGRTLYLEWGRQLAMFGTVAYRIQISINGTAWYKPNVTKDPYANENNWRENDTLTGFLEVTEATYFQVVPLTGQNTVLPTGGYSISPKTYYYRVYAVNTESGQTSDWSTAIMLTAEGTSAQDILNNSVGWDKIVDGSILVEKLGVKRLIAGESTLAFIGNNTNVSDKTRAGFQYWALDTITINGVQFRKGEFRINSDTGDFFIVDPTNGISFKASRVEITALGSNVYGNFSVFDTKNGNEQFSVDLLDESGAVKITPSITIGKSGKFSINMHGPLKTDSSIEGQSILLRQSENIYFGIRNDGTMSRFNNGSTEWSISKMPIMGTNTLMVSNLPLSCSSLISAGDINGTTVRSTWTAVDAKLVRSDIDGIAYGAGKFVATGYAVISYSTDGITWTAVDDAKFGTSMIRDIVYGGDRFVAVGSNGKMAASTNGITWAAISDSKFAGDIIFSIDYGGDKFVAVGNGGKGSYSTNGTSWTAVGDMKMGGNRIYDVAYGSGKFVAVGDGGKGSYSSDGITWTAVSNMSFGTTNITAIGYGDGMFIAGADHGYMAYSTDGINWTQVINPKMGSNVIRSIACMGPVRKETGGYISKYVAVGDSGSMSYSTDGKNWIAINTTTFGSIDIQCIACNYEKFVAGGNGGNAAYSTMSNILAKLLFDSDGSVKWGMV